MHPVQSANVRNIASAGGQSGASRKGSAPGRVPLPNLGLRNQPFPNKSTEPSNVGFVGGKQPATYFTPPAIDKSKGGFANYFTPQRANQEVPSAKLVAKASVGGSIGPLPPTCSVASTNVAAALQVNFFINVLKLHKEMFRKARLYRMHLENPQSKKTKMNKAGGL